MRDRRDDADLADAVVEPVAARGLAVGVRDLDQRPEFFHALQYFFERHDDLGAPHAVLFEWHEFDEAQHYGLFARELAKGDDLVVVEAAQQYAVHLHWLEPGALGGTDAGEDVVESIGHAGD